jgi:hypothetical protein
MKSAGILVVEKKQWGKAKGKVPTRTEVLHASFLGELKVALSLQAHDVRTRIGIVEYLVPIQV